MSEDAGGEVDRDISTDAYVNALRNQARFWSLISWVWRSFCRVLSGFVEAIKDPKVLILALASCSQLLGSSFVNFFPTSIQVFSWSTEYTRSSWIFFLT